MIGRDGRIVEVRALNRQELVGSRVELEGLAHPGGHDSSIKTGRQAGEGGLKWVQTYPLAWKVGQ